MKSRLWSGKWSEGKLIDADTPFGSPFYPGCDCYFRPCEIGVAVYMETAGKSAIRYISQYQCETSFSGVEVCEDTEELTEQFELMREELKAGAATEPTPTVDGEVSVPGGIPLVYSNAVVHTGRMLSDLHEPCWLADWWYDKDGRMHICFEKQAVYAAVSRHDQDFIDKTLKHETFEARAALREAKKDYGDIAPAEYNALATQFDGIAHAVTVRVVEGYTSEKLYNKFISKWVEKADLPSPPLQHELS